MATITGGDEEGKRENEKGAAEGMATITGGAEEGKCENEKGLRWEWRP